MTLDFLRHVHRCPRQFKKTAPGSVSPHGPDAHWTHRWPEYPLPSCVPTEPGSGFSGSAMIRKHTITDRITGTPVLIPRKSTDRRGSERRSTALRLLDRRGIHQPAIDADLPREACVRPNQRSQRSIFHVTRCVIRRWVNRDFHSATRPDRCSGLSSCRAVEFLSASRADLPTPPPSDACPRKSRERRTRKLRQVLHGPFGRTQQWDHHSSLLSINGAIPCPNTLGKAVAEGVVEASRISGTADNPRQTPHELATTLAALERAQQRSQLHPPCVDRPERARWRHCTPTRTIPRLLRPETHSLPVRPRGENR